MFKRPAPIFPRLAATRRGVMVQVLRRAAALACCAWSLAMPLGAHAWLVGQTSDFSGPTAPGVKENTAGALLYFKAVNARGGVHGRPVELRAMDDHFDPEQTRSTAQQLIADPAVLALFLIRGTPNAEAVLPLLVEHKIALVAPSTGAMSLRTPLHPWVFNVRASYQREAERAIQHLVQVGTTRIAIVHIDNSFGADALVGARKGLAAAGKEASFIEKFSPKTPDFAPIVGRIKAEAPQAILLLGAAKLVATAVKEIREAGSAAQIVTLSNNASSGFIQELGSHAKGVIVTQVFPSERSLSSPLVREAMDTAKFFGEQELTPAMLEGFAGAKVMVEALRRAGPHPTRQKVKAALESFKDYDLGGLKLSYGPDDHSGLDFVDLAIIGASGKFVR